MSRSFLFRGQWRTFLRRIAIGAALSVLIGLGFIGWCNLAPVLKANNSLFTEAASVPHHRAGLIFGCDPWIKGRPNLYFLHRIESAVQLWDAGKVDWLIVSGDNRQKNYNEPRTMRRALVARGVPDNRIISDASGLRTLDSVVRAKEVFGLDEVVFISQRFQNQRAIYLASAHGMNAVGFDAPDPSKSWLSKTRVREIGARVKMWLDVHILSTRPRHLDHHIGLPDTLAE